MIPSRIPGSSDTPFSETEGYVGRLMGLPLPQAAMIYRAGKPWPVSLDNFDRVVQQEAEALRCSLDEARRIVLERLQWQRANAENSGRPMNTAVHEIGHRYQARVAQRLQEDLATITKVHHAVLKYRWQEGKQPD
jgi:hypothetical protein